jgi:hypothetical protein
VGVGGEGRGGGRRYGEGGRKVDGDGVGRGEGKAGCGVRAFFNEAWS